MISGNGQFGELHRFSLPQTSLPQLQVLMQFVPQPSMQRAANWARRVSQQQVLVKQHIACTGDTVPCMGTQQGHPAFQGAGEAAGLPSACTMVLDLPQLSRSSEHTLGRAQTWPVRSGLPWGHRAQNPSVVPPPAPTPVQFWGRRAFNQPSHPFCCYSCISCNHTSACELLKGFKGLPNGEEAARQEIMVP